MTPPSLKNRILDANRRMHGLPGYVADYDARNPYMVSALAQREFWADLRRIHRRLGGPTSAPRPSLGPPPRALDLGAGTGNLTLKLMALGYDVTALDLSEAMLDRLCVKARALPQSQRRRLNVTAADAETFLSAPGPPFDAIVMCSFLHHLPDYAAILALCARRLSARGVIYFTHEPLPPRRPGPALRALTLADRAAFLLRERRLGAKLAAKARHLLGKKHDNSQRNSPRWRNSLRWRNSPELRLQNHASNLDNTDQDEDAEINRLTLLADYHVFRRGIEPHVVRRAFTAQGLTFRLSAYTLMNTPWATRLARRLGVRDMVKGFAWRKC